MEHRNRGTDRLLPVSGCDPFKTFRSIEKSKPHETQLMDKDSEKRASGLTKHLPTRSLTL